ncbi:MAG TPA: hypothetical protein VLB50_09955 [Ignavibacteriaceae bacterium]|nr:hypothetical protein [Ignavibacteriaceae bacterium]
MGLQISGQIFTNQGADNLFGPVITSVSIPKITFQFFLTKTDNYIMFKVEDNKAIVIDNNRKVISPEGTIINPTDKFTVYKVSVVNELLSKSNENIVYIQQRNNVLSVSIGGFTMEVGSICPPFCP